MYDLIIFPIRFWTLGDFVSPTVRTNVTNPKCQTLSGILGNSKYNLMLFRAFIEVIWGGIMARFRDELQ